MKKKLALYGGILLVVLVLTAGTYAYTFPVASTTIAATAGEGNIATLEPASEPEQPDWLSILPTGEATTEPLLPMAPGDQTSIPAQFPNSGQHWEKVDDLPADDSTTYVSTAGTGSYVRDLYNLSDHTEGSGPELITGITVYFRFRAEQTYDVAYARASVKTHGTVYDGAVETQTGTTWVTRSYQWVNNPATNQPWTWEEINDLQAGINLKGTSINKYALCTQVYVAVNFDTFVTEGALPQGDMFIVTPHPAYTGDLLVSVYLTNSGAMLKALKYYNMKVYVADSVEAGKTPDYQVLSLENGVVRFNIEGDTAASYTVELTGGSYRLLSEDPGDWGDGWTVTPELFLEVSQR